MSTAAPPAKQLTAPNLFVEADNGITYATAASVALRSGGRLCCSCNTCGNLDNWDPLLVDAIATEREVILLDNTGVGGSSGRTPNTVTAMAYDTLAFVDALGLHTLDVLGFSLGG